MLKWNYFWVSCCFVLVWVVVVNGIVSFNLNNITLPFSKLTPPSTPYLFFLVYQRGFLLLLPHKCNSVPSIAWGTVMSHNKIIAFQRRGPTQHPVQILVITTPIIPVGPTHTEKDVAGIYTKNSPCIKKIIFRQTTQRYSHKTALHDL